jgi:hypothetical protein
MQPVRRIEPVLVYIAKYVSKPEESSHSHKQYILDMMRTMNPKAGSKTVLQKLLIRSIGESNISAQETNHLLMGLPLRGSSRVFVSLNAYAQEYNTIDMSHDAELDDQELLK